MILPTGARLYIYAGIAAIFLAVLTFAGCEHANAKGARADRTVAISNTKIALDANNSLLASVASLEQTIEVWKRLATPAAKMRAAAARAAELEVENNRLNAALDKRAEPDYAKPECNAVLDMDFERVCPNVAAGLRARASRYENRVSGQASAGGGEDRSIFD